MSEGLLALIVAAATVVGLVLGARIQARKDAHRMTLAPAGWRELWVPGSLLVLCVVFVALVMGMGIARLQHWMDRYELLVRRPIGNVRIADEVWRVKGGSRVTRLQVQPAPDDARDGDGARATVELSGPADTAAIQVDGDDLPEGFELARVRLYVENSETARQAGLHAHLAVRMNAGSNGSFSQVGERTPLVPGTWTEVVWAGSYTIELSPAMGGDSIDKRVRASDRLTWLAVHLEGDEPFRGSVFVDDLQVYPAAAPRRDDQR